ncbi:MAG: hypothetical protein WAL75_13560 [Terracidiphilus sp.]
MRTTITLDDDVHEYVSNYAEAKGMTLSAAIGELIRKAESAPQPEKVELRRGLNGFPLLPRSGGVITSEMVKRLSEDDLG